MTTQIPYGPVGAEFPQFAAGHAQYPPAEHHEPYRSAAAYPGHPAAAGPVQYPPAGYLGEPGYQEQNGYRDPPAYPTPPSYATTPDYAAPAGHAAPAGQATQAGHAGYAPQATAAATYPPPAAYPMAPPWATQSPTPESFAPEVPAPVVAPQVGGLLVPYPEEMQNAPQAQAPALWPVAVFTFMFGIFGAISAARRADQARRGRNSAAPYWVTFVVTLVAGSFFWIVSGVAVGAPAAAEYREGRIVEALEKNVVGDGQLAKANVSATDAQCRAAGDRRDDGTRDYLCQLTLGDGRTGQVMVTADKDGGWKPLTGR
ncbi:hypothetical protein [Actinoplanes sp. NPDC049316]|uniref:hypothetical protein n=1 Tax=Actinoplanes sp. NPDC049316 TaxID=3154727 RepID=UPI003418ADC8